MGDSLATQTTKMADDLVSNAAIDATVNEGQGPNICVTDHHKIN